MSTLKLDLRFLKSKVVNGTILVNTNMMLKVSLLEKMKFNPISKLLMNYKSIVLTQFKLGLMSLIIDTITLQPFTIYCR